MRDCDLNQHQPMARKPTRKPRSKSAAKKPPSPQGRARGRSGDVGRGSRQRGRGRPSDFKPEFCDQAEKLCKLHNSTDEELAAFFEKGLATISRWKKAHLEFREAIARGKAVADMEVADSLYRRAKGFEWTEDLAIKVKEVHYSDGKRVSEIERVEIVRVHKAVPADTNACMAWLSNRQKEKWRNKVDHESGGKAIGPVLLYTDDERL